MAEFAQRWKGWRTWALALAFLSATLLVPAHAARAASGYRSSTGNTAVFTDCDQGYCANQYFAWDGFVHTDYDFVDLYNYTVHFEDQSTIMHNAANSTCGIDLGIYTDTNVGTITVQQAGSYVYSSADRNWGGYAWPEWTVNSMTARAWSSSYGCSGGGGFSFYAGP